MAYINGKKVLTIVKSNGGGGTNVVPNPVGTPTADLETVQIDNTIYSVGEDRKIASFTPKETSDKISISTDISTWYEVMQGAIYKCRARGFTTNQLFFTNKSFYDLVKNKDISFKLPCTFTGDLMLPDNTTLPFNMDQDLVFDYCRTYTDNNEDFYEYIGKFVYKLGLSTFDIQVVLDIKKTDTPHLSWSDIDGYGTLITTTTLICEGELIILD